jgi:hypothetical protein
MDGKLHALARQLLGSRLAELAAAGRLQRLPDPADVPPPPPPAAQQRRQWHARRRQQPPSHHQLHQPHQPQQEQQEQQQQEQQQERQRLLREANGAAAAHDGPFPSERGEASAVARAAPGKFGARAACRVSCLHAWYPRSRVLPPNHPPSHPVPLLHTRRRALTTA